MVDTRFSYSNYMIRRKVLKFFGGAFHIYNPANELAFFCEMKAFKLKEDIRLYTGEDKQTEVLRISARQIIDIAATYDIYDSTDAQKIGALRRKGLKSIIKDEWIIMDSQDREIGLIAEDSMAMALLRRFLTNLIPQKFDGTINGMTVFKFKQNFNPFVLKINMDFSMDMGKMLDRRMGIAAAILLSAIEGRQD